MANYRSKSLDCSELGLAVSRVVITTFKLG
jgi:hypothetical protein